MPRAGARVEEPRSRSRAGPFIRANLPSHRRHSRQRLSVVRDGACGRVHLRHVRNWRRIPHDAAVDLHRRAAGRRGRQRHHACGGLFLLGRDRLLATQRARQHAGADAARRRHFREHGRSRAVHLAARARSARPRHRPVLRHASRHRRRVDDRRERARHQPQPPGQARRIAPPGQSCLVSRVAVEAAVQALEGLRLGDPGAGDRLHHRFHRRDHGHRRRVSARADADLPGAGADRDRDRHLHGPDLRHHGDGHRAACGDQPPRRRRARAHPDGRRRDRRAIRCACRAAHPRRVAAAFSRAARSFGRPAFRVRARADAEDLYSIRLMRSGP